MISKMTTFLILAFGSRVQAAIEAAASYWRQNMDVAVRVVNMRFVKPLRYTVD